MYRVELNIRVVYEATSETHTSSTTSMNEIEGLDSALWAYETLTIAMLQAIATQRTQRVANADKT